jgi:hypothetical protein
MEEQLVALLLKSAALTALVGANIQWGRAPQGMQGKRYVVLQVISAPRDYTMQRASGHVEARVQADAYASSYTDAKRIARALRAAVSGRRVGAIHAIFVSDERDLPAADPGEVNHLFRTSQDLIIHHTE